MALVQRHYPPSAQTLSSKAQASSSSSAFSGKRQSPKSHRLTYHQNLTSQRSNQRAQRAPKPPTLPKMAVQNIKRPAAEMKSVSPAIERSPLGKRKSEEVNGAEKLIQLTPKKRCVIDESSLEIYQRRRPELEYLAALRKKRNLANSVTSSWNGLKAAAQKGMQNITGALCYRNSLLQAIFHQPKIVRWLVQTHKLESCTSDDEQKCLCCAVRGLVVAYWREGKVTYEALNNIDAIFHHHGWRAGSRSGQADPDEQATWLFNAMRESLPTSVFSQFEAFMHVGTTSVTCCLKCKHESRKLGDEERCLSLPIAPRVRGGSVEDYLDRYLREFVQDYTCEKCKDNKSQKERDIRIAHAPDVLTIQLKRFDWDGRKDSVHVTINERLDLGDYRDTGNEQSMRYELSAVIKHTGNAVSGHYISAAKGPDGQWCEYNDSFKKIRSLEDVVSGKNFTPYILYYQRMEA